MEWGHLLLCLPARKVSDRKNKDLPPTERAQRASHSHHPFLFPAFAATLSPFVIHGRAKPQF